MSLSDILPSIFSATLILPARPQYFFPDRLLLPLYTCHSQSLFSIMLDVSSILSMMLVHKAFV